MMTFTPEQIAMATQNLSDYFGTATFTRTQAQRMHLHHALYIAVMNGTALVVRANVFRMA